jgi:hypothetical protein
MNNFFYFENKEISMTKAGLINIGGDITKMDFILNKVIKKMTGDTEYINELLKEKEEDLKNLKKIYFGIKEKKLDKNSDKSMRNILKNMLEREINFYKKFNDFQSNDYYKWLFENQNKLY